MLQKLLYSSNQFELLHIYNNFDNFEFNKIIFKSTLKKNIVNFNKYLVEYCQLNIY